MANAVPLAPTLMSPPNNNFVTVSAPFVFDWEFNDPGDTQASASLRYRREDDLPGWTTLVDVVAAPSAYTMAGGVLSSTPGHTYEWQVQTKDSANQWSLWSASRFFQPGATTPAPTITSPAVLESIGYTPVTVSWTIPISPPGLSQDAYQVKSYADSPPTIVFYDSGVVEGAALSAVVPLPMFNGGITLIEVRFRHGEKWSAAAGVGISNAILPPVTPLLVLAQVPDRPEVVVSVTTPAPSDAAHLATLTWDLTRDGVRIARGLPPNSSFTDLLVGAGEVAYIATATTANGGTVTSF